MNDSLKVALREAILSLLNPLAQLLLKVGMGVGEVRRLMDEAYVLAAQHRSDGDDASARPNITHIAVQTGLPRAEVARILSSKPGATSEVGRGLQRAQRVLGGWWADPDFHDSRGSPAALPMTGARASFEALVKRYSGDPRAAAILKELKRSRAIRQLPDGRVLATSRSVASAQFDPAGLTEMGEQISEHLQTLIFNAQNPTRPRFVRRLVNRRVSERHVARLIRDLEQQMQTFGDAVHDEINDPDVTVKPRDHTHPAHGLGVTFYISERRASTRADSKEAPRRRRR